MKLQINTEQKSITINENVNAHQLFELLKTWFPKGEWKKWTITSEVITNAISYPQYVYPWWEYQPYKIWYGDTVTTGDTNYLVSIETKQHPTIL